MATKKQAYPLYWPKHWARTKSRTGSQFKSSLARAMGNVEDSLRRFASDSGKKIEGLMISSNFSLTDQNPADPGVACYFSWDGIDTCICVDRYQKLQDNIQAIHHCIEAERTKLRHGGLNLVRAAFRGYAALPPPPKAGPPWYEVLGLAQDAGQVEASAMHKKLRSKHHPDNGGDPHEFAKFQRAWDEYKAQLRN